MRKESSAALVLAALLAGAVSAQDDDQRLAWPRVLETEAGRVVIYQPQPDRLAGDTLEGRAAISVSLAGGETPQFGAVWFKALLDTDIEARVATIVNVGIPRIRFPAASEEQTAGLSEYLERELSAWELEISLDRLVASLELSDADYRTATNLGTAPPNIIVSLEPAVLITIAGDPILRPMGDSELRRVVNTPFVVVQDPGDRRYYLYAGADAWLTAVEVDGPWTVAAQLPESVGAIVPPDSAGAVASEEPVELAELHVYVVTEPSELIVIEGNPEYSPIEGVGDLLFVANSESDIVLEIETQHYFIVLAGRWYTAAGLDGPWSYVAADSLPQSFAEIPADSPVGDVLTFVAGSDEAIDAVLESQIPQTSAVKRDATLEVSYDGEPRFEPIEGTEMRYAVNTTHQVLEIAGRYYACSEAVWYESADPTGPFTVAVAVPEAVNDIPPDNPNYNVKYVYVYDHTPDVVYVGYTPGYVGNYVYGPCIVYGTGFWYRPWIGPYYYYPRPYTWGFRATYNPWYGWSIGFGFSTGRFHFGFASRPSYYRPLGWWGPAGYPRYRYSGVRRNVNINTGDIHIDRRSNIYSRAENRSRNVDRSAARAQLADLRSRRGGDEAAQRAEVTGQPQTRGRQRPQVAGAVANDVYTDREGNVYRRSERGWEQRERDGWRSTNLPTTAERQPRAGGRPATPETRQPRIPNRQVNPAGPSSRDLNRSRQLNRDYSGRQRGAQRSQSFQRSRGRVGVGGARRRR